MRATLVLAAAVLTHCVFAAEQVNVSICNLGGLKESVVRKARAETEAVFRPSKIRIEWSDCDQPSGPRTFIIRLRADKPPHTAGPSSLDAMGRAFLGKDGSGYLADAYFQSVRELSDLHGADAAALLGVVIAHELGHLLLGPGHTPNGVMRSAWGSREMRAVGQRWLKFNREQRAKMQRMLSPQQTRAVPEQTNVNIGSISSTVARPLLSTVSVSKYSHIRR